MNKNIEDKIQAQKTTEKQAVKVRSWPFSALLCPYLLLSALVCSCLLFVCSLSANTDSTL
jgi:hypothetical protein